MSERGVKVLRCQFSPILPEGKFAFFSAILHSPLHSNRRSFKHSISVFLYVFILLVLSYIHISIFQDGYTLYPRPWMDHAESSTVMGSSLNEHNSLCLIPICWLPNFPVPSHSSFLSPLSSWSGSRAPRFTVQLTCQARLAWSLPAPQFCKGDT